MKTGSKVKTAFTLQGYYPDYNWGIGTVPNEPGTVKKIRVDRIDVEYRIKGRRFVCPCDRKTFYECFEAA